MSEAVGHLYYDVTLETGQMIRGQREAQKALDATAGALNRFDAKLTAITRAVSVYAAALAAIKFAKTADDLRLLQARVDVATGSIEAGAAAMAQLEDISRRTNTAIAGNVQVFTRLNSSIKQMGGAEADTLRITELLAKAITVSGASAQEKTSAMVQFGQALGSGKLAGDELRSLLENAPYLMQQLAAGIGVPVGALKGLGEQGKLTSDVVVNALSKAADKISADFAQFPQTLDAAMTAAGDAAQRAVKTVDDVSGSSSVLTGIVNGTTKALDDLVAAFGGVDKEAAKLTRQQAIELWSGRARLAFSYVADAADVTWQTLSVLGRNVAFVFEGVGKEIGGIGAQVAAVLRGDFAGARAIGEAMKAEQAERRRELDAADAKTLADRKLWGAQMRDAALQARVEDRGFTPAGRASKLTAVADPEEQRKLAARRASAQAYYEGLLADARTGLEKIDAEEQKALSDNTRRMAQDVANRATYEKAKVAITEKFARERRLLEERTAEEVGAFNIAMTTGVEAKIDAIRSEAFRSADAQVRLGVITFAEGERKKTLAVAQGAEQRAALQERHTQTIAETAYAAEVDAIRRIDLARQEAYRRADAAVKAGAITAAQAEADKARAAVDAQNAVRQQVLSINPLAALEAEYQQKLAIVQLYETRMAAAGVEGAQFVEQKRTELARQFQQQRQAIAEAEFVMQSDANKLVIDSLNAMGQTASSAIVGLIEHTTTAQEAMRALGHVVLNEAVSALVQIGVQAIKNALVGEAADKAMMAGKAANAAIYTSAVSAQVAVTSALAAQAAFAATAAIPVVGPALAPGAAAAAGAVAAGLGAPAVALAPVAGARQYGGPTDAGSLYRINETGRPEMFTGSNGAQYLLPTQRGSVTPADKVGGQAPTVIIENHGQPMRVTSQSWESDSRTLRLAVAEVASQIRNNEGEVYRALVTSTNVQSRL